MNPQSIPHDLVDIGVNLADAVFDGDRVAVIDRAVAAGVRRLVITGTTVAESERAVEVARTRPGVLFATAGIHPNHSHEAEPDAIAAVRALQQQPEVVAIGECGFDCVRDRSPLAVQERWFEAQIELAVQLQRPLFVHDREAAPRVAAMLRARRSSFPRAVVHCFTGDSAALRAYLDLDLHIGITGWICDERRGLPLRDLVRLVPADRLMLETDAPYLLPRTLRPLPKTRRNEPMWLPAVLETVAAARGESVADVAIATTATARRFFGLP